MSVINIINEELELYERIISNEEYNPGDNQLYGYHVTSMQNLESIFNQGFQIGKRQMQGRGFYAFYDYNHALQYLMKGEVQNPVMVKFVVTCKQCLLYLNMDIAKQVLGEKYHLKQQIEDYFKYRGGLEFLLKEAQTVYRKDMTIEGLIQILDNIEENNSESNQRLFVFNLISSNTNDRLDIVWNGNYGLEYRINYTGILEPLGYYDFTTKDRTYHKKVEKSIVPDTDEYQELRQVLNDSGYTGTKQELLTIKDWAYNKLNIVRNNRDYNYYMSIIELINKLV